MDVLQNLGMGFAIALMPVNLLYCFVGVLIGTAIGVLPGIGPVTAVAVLLPLTFGMNPTSGLIMLAGIYYGSQYGGSTTAILINTPGESASIMTCLDGYQMARKGRAGPALGMAAIGSFIAGTIGVVLLMFLARPLVTVALSFGPAEYFALMLLALCTLGGIVGQSVAKGLLAGAFGLFLGTIGADPMTGAARFTYGIPSLLDGLEFLPVAIGLFAVAEVLTTAERSLEREIYDTRIAGLLPTREDWRACRVTLPRASLIGFVIGVLPGAGSTLASMLAYLAEKRASRYPERFGTGVIEGVAAPEAANNAASAGAMVPLLTLGVPGSGTTAVMLGALMLWGLRPGPLLFEKNADLVWGLIASMYVGNVMLLILNLPLIGLWVRLLRVPTRVLLPLILVFSFTGTYAVSNNVFDLYVMVTFGIIGFVLQRYEFPVAPIVLGLILGPMLETHLRRALILSRGDWSTFVERPISAFLLAAVVVYLALPLIVWAWKRTTRPPGSQ
ncbi:MAG: tripartite tricarboxylate transporter permease [Candidatus Rokubacteria bacterium]|nr:tripartite tricarboxylate transporter permease [Candidatus Rokubacteria bacterium]